MSGAELEHLVEFCLGNLKSYLFLLMLFIIDKANHFQTGLEIYGLPTISKN